MSKVMKLTQSLAGILYTRLEWWSRPPNNAFGLRAEGSEDGTTVSSRDLKSKSCVCSAGLRGSAEEDKDAVGVRNHL